MPASGSSFGFAEHRRTHASFAEVAVVAVALLQDGQVERVRLAVAGLADRPLRLTEVEESLVGVGAGALAARAREIAQLVKELSAISHDESEAEHDAEIVLRAGYAALAGS